MADETPDAQYSYDANTLRGALARVVQARAEAKLAEQNEELGTEHALDVPLAAVAEALEGDERTYDRLIDVMDSYFDDWAFEVAEKLGLQDE